MEKERKGGRVGLKGREREERNIVKEGTRDSKRE